MPRKRKMEVSPNLASFNISLMPDGSVMIISDFSDSRAIVLLFTAIINGTLNNTLIESIKLRLDAQHDTELQKYMIPLLQELASKTKNNNQNDSDDEPLVDPAKVFGSNVYNGGSDNGK